MKILMTKDGSRPYAENASGDVLSTFNRAVLGQLLEVGKILELAPGLVSRWKWNSEDSTYELWLREGLEFHDGTKVMSEDLEFSLLRGFFSNNGHFMKYIWETLRVLKIFVQVLPLSQEPYQGLKLLALSQ